MNLLILRFVVPPLLHLSYVQTEIIVHKKLQTTDKTALNKIQSDVIKCTRF
jgi:hypothetical protein